MYIYDLTPTCITSPRTAHCISYLCIYCRRAHTHIYCYTTTAERDVQLHGFQTTYKNILKPICKEETWSWQYIYIYCIYPIINYHSFIHLAVCLTTGPKPLPKRALHIVRSRSSSFKWEYPLFSLRSSNSFLHLLPCLPVTSIPPCIFPSVTRCRMQFLHKMWPIQFAFRLRISCKIFLCSLTLYSSYHIISYQMTISELLHYEKRFVWCWNLDTSKSRSKIPGKFRNAVLESGGEDQLDRSCEKCRSVTYVELKRRGIPYVHLKER
jgi:hypothetical protein